MKSTQVCKGLSAFLAAVFFLTAILVQAAPQTLAITGEEQEAPRTLLVRGDHNYPPYEFVNDQGRPDGFNVDIITAVAKAMGLAVNIHLGPWEVVRSQLAAGEIDALIGMFRTSEREKSFDFSIPHFIASYAVFVRQGSPIQSLADVTNRKIIVQLDDLGHDYLVENRISPHLILKQDWAEVLTSLANGEGDCAIVSRVQGTRLIDRLGITNLAIVGPPIIQRKYCLAVTEGNTDLLAKLNEGLSIVKHNGTYDEIYEKWFGSIEEKPLSPLRVLQYLGWVVLPLLLLTVAGFLWSWLLRRQVALRTIALRRELGERRRAEEELRTVNELLTLFIKHSPIYAFIKEVTPERSTTLRASENYLDMIGIAGSAMAGKTMHEIFPPQFADKITADDWAVVSRGEILRLDEELNGRSYTTIKFPILLGGKKLLAGYTIDITDRIRVEEELRRRENQLQRIFEILPIGLWFTDKEGTLLRGNPMGVKIWGAEPHVPINEYGVFKAWRLPSREEVKADDWALAKTIRQGVTIVDELLEIETFDGRRKTILNYTAPILTEDGTLDGAIVVNLDVSDRMSLEEQLLQARKMESVGRLAGGVAHDFNNMLSVILGHTELALAEVAADEPLAACLESIREAGQRSTELTRQLLAFARKQTVAPRVLDLNETVEGLLKMLRRLIGEHIELVWHPGRNLGAVRIDPSQVDQILVNLCVNARDACAETGKVTIETAAVAFDADYCASHAEVAPGDYLLLTVSDNGAGMDAATLPHLFEPFFTTKELGKGTGLGLATVYGIVKQNDGFINVTSEKGVGTSFAVYLPRHNAEADRPLEATGGAAAVGAETILLVEDEPMILRMTSGMLARLGYTVLPAASPGEALRLAGKHADEIHLLFTDVVMPEMNGRDLADKLLSLYPGLRTLFMSGYTADVIASQGILDPGVHFIQKPFALNDLAAKIRAVLQ
jgi:signal transduction histidine kinase/ABC-type amino acid transport substrate-binding protein